MSKPCYCCQCCCDPEKNKCSPHSNRPRKRQGTKALCFLQQKSIRQISSLPDPGMFTLTLFLSMLRTIHNFIDCYCIALNTRVDVCLYIYVECAYMCMLQKSIQFNFQKCLFFISFWTWTCFRKEVYLARYDENGVLRLFHHTHDDTVKERVARIIHDGLMEMWDVEQLFDLQVIIQEKVRST